MTVTARWRAGLLAGAGACALLGGVGTAEAQITPPSADQCVQNPTLLGCPTAPVAANPSAATANPVQPAASTSADAGEIVVTGTNIRQPNLTSPVPVTSVTAPTLLATGNLSVGDALNQLPALRATFSQANSTQFIGTAGVNFLDLRGLGTSRTLVLVNGRRHVSSSPGDYLVDTNTIPQNLLERVDVVTGGSSAVYGTDAMAGVVNFVLKQNYEGLEFGGQGGMSGRGDRGAYSLNAIYGKNFAEGRGNITLSADYAHQNALYFTDRDAQTGAFTGRKQIQRQQDLSDTANLSDGKADYGFYNGVRSGTIADGSTLTAVCNAANAANLARCRASGFPQRYVFQPDGSLVLNNPTIDFRDITNGGSNNTLGGMTSTLNNTGQLGPKLDRVNLNLLAHFEVSDAFQPFVEAKYVRIRAKQQGQPSFLSGGIVNGLGGGAEITCANPFLTSQALTTLQSIGRCATPDSTLTLGRYNVDFGGRGELEKRDTFRIVGGARGDFLDTWHYEVAANYGRFRGSTTSLNNLLLFNQSLTQPAGFLNAINAVRNSAGQIVCSINADADTTNDDPRCVPISLFGARNSTLTRQALDYINTTAYNRQRASELDITANVNGDLSKLFTTWGGGSLAFNIGAEYRRETASSIWDDLTKAGATFLNSIPDFLPPPLKSKEGYAEVNLPIIKGRRFAEELSINGAARYSHYNTVGGVWSYNGGAIYAPVRDLKLRFGYARSIRTPTQSDLYGAAFQNYGFIDDPCDTQFINTGTATRAANCAAAGIPAGFVNQPARESSLSYRSGGNPNLTPETSNSYTIGGIITPRFVPGLSLSVDYYRITINNVIQTIDAQQTVDNCYDAASLANVYCGLIYRDPTTKLFLDPAVLAGPVNFARQKTNGIDATLSYARRLGNGDRFNLQANGSLVLRRDNYLDVSNPNRVSQQLGNLGDPKWKATVNVDYQHNIFSLHYQMRFVGHQYIGEYANYYSLNGEDPQEPEYYIPRRYPTRIYHSIKFAADISKGYQFYVGVDNLTDKLPPLGILGVSGGEAIYDNIGRYFYAGFRVRI